MQRILIQAAPCCQGNSKCLRKHGDGDAGFTSGRIRMGEGDAGSDKDPSSEGHWRNASVLAGCAKSGSADSLTCKHSGGSAGSHTLTYMLHLEETKRQREGQLMREVEGGAAVHWENERHRAPAARGVERNGEKRSLIAPAASSSDFCLL